MWLCRIAPGFDPQQREVARQALSTVPDAAVIPALVQLLRERGDIRHMAFSLECLGDRGRAAVFAIPEITKLLQEDATDSHPQYVLRLAARVLTGLGPDAKSRLPVLRDVAARRSSKEWKMLMGSQPVLTKNLQGEAIYSDDEYTMRFARSAGNEEDAASLELFLARSSFHEEMSTPVSSKPLLLCPGAAWTWAHWSACSRSSPKT